MEKTGQTKTSIHRIFPLLKKHLRGRIFDHRDNLEGEVRRVLMHEIPRRAYADAINACILHAMDQVLQAEG
ncbi:hypothetical protein BOX15_Mlig004435g2 [Macrostomum lignano]|uniref:Uncharacterized protein n=1 Tax=Macrostomum lignano TaxID=282301 RepID=A0A267H573_9PLAT|nr:hypothetical protein BOX15_Mlig004435g1 [Macrostomum lignano]PAA92834.1 hypothetical protein BOX15_Mlig004435g2 [Macrostomum lignano]